MSARRAFTLALRNLVVAGALASGGAATATAQPLGGQPTLQVIVGGPPGGLFDIALRIVAERLGKELGRTVVIENKPGAGTAVALAYARTAPADGSSVAMINLSATANETLIPKRGYRLLEDFEPIGLYAFPSNVLIVNPGLGARDLPGLIRVLRERGDAANFSSGGVGSPGHLAGELFKTRTGTRMVHVPYKGAPPAVLAVVTGEVDLMFATASAALGQVAAGKVAALAVTTRERLPQLPGVPSMAEAGLPDFEVSDWLAVIAPKAVPAAVRDGLHAALSAAFADPEAAAKLRQASFLPAAPALGPEALRAFLRAEIDKWAKVVAEAKIPVQ